MDGEANYTPLDVFKLSPKKKSFEKSNKILIGLIIFFVIGIGTVGYYLVLQKKITTKVPATTDVGITESPTPIPPNFLDNTLREREEWGWVC